ncbi:hypothetical protein BJX70DRAFT_392822 [Aspergillus crustosus]
MNDHPTATTTIKTIGLREVCEVNGRRFTRIRGTQEWTEYQQDSSTLFNTPEPIYLSLSFFVARQNRSGSASQVTGDAQFKTYKPTAEDITRDDCFHPAYQLAISPPQAPGRNVRVVSKLVDRGIVAREKLEMARSMMEPV